jgi:hypothetical protein
MKMNDDFIYKALPKVRRDFAQSLYTKISVDTNHHLKAQIHPVQRISRRLQVALILLGVLILVAWSQIRFWIRYVPIGDLWLIEFSSSTQQVRSDAIATPFVPQPYQLPTAIIEINGTEVVLQNTYMFTNMAPDWIPDGFSAINPPGPGYAFEESIGMWSNNAGETIRLFAVPRAGGARPYAPPGMYREVQINDKPAVMIFGRLAPNSADNPHTQRLWDKALGLQLTWSAQNTIYTLETLGSYVTEDELIRMAESMKKIPVSFETTVP